MGEAHTASDLWADRPGELSERQGWGETGQGQVGQLGEIVSRRKMREATVKGEVSMLLGRGGGRT